MNQGFEGKNFVCKLYFVFGSYNKEWDKMVLVEQ